MNKRIVQLVKSPDANKRREGIKLLAQSKDPKSLDLLSLVFKREQDPRLKTLAGSVGKSLKKKFAEKPKRTSSPETKQTIVQEKDQRKARWMMDRAVEELGDSEYMEAQNLVRKAFRLDPFLQEDNYYLDIAANIFGVPTDEVLDIALPAHEGNFKLDDVFDGAKQSIQAKFGTPFKRKKSPEQAIQESRELMEQAESHLADFNYAQAQQLVYQAFELNPDLRHDKYCRGLLVDIFATSEKEAVRMALGIESEDDLEIKRLVEAERKANPEIGHVDALKDILIMGGLAAVLSFSGVIAIILTLGNRIRALIDVSEGEYATFIAREYGHIASLDLMTAISAALAASIATMTWIFLQSVSIHLAVPLARMGILGGGSRTGLEKALDFISGDHHRYYGRIKHL